MQRLYVGDIFLFQPKKLWSELYVPHCHRPDGKLSLKNLMQMSVPGSIVFPAPNSFPLGTSECDLIWNGFADVAKEVILD